MKFTAAIRRWRKMLLENSSLRQTIFKNTFWLTVSNLTGRLIRAGLLIYVARILGAAGYGVFSYVVGLASFFSLFSDIGVNGMLTREGAKNPQAFPELLGTSLALKTILVSLSVALLLVAVPFINHVPEALPLIPLAALLVVFDGFRDLTFSITRASERMEQEALINITTNLSITALGIILLLLHPTPLTLMAGYTAGSGAGTLAAFWMLRRHFRNFWEHIRPRRMLPILKEGFPFAMLGLMGTVMLNTDMVMLGWFMNAEALGLYSAAQRPIQILYLIPMILSTALFPVMARFAAEDRDKFRRLLERGITFSLLIAIPIFAGGLAMGRSFILLLFGRGFEGATLSFMILLATILLNFPGTLVGNAIFAYNKQKSFLAFLAIGAVGNVIFNILLIPRWGIAGSSLSTIISQGLANFYIWWKLKTINNFRTLAHLQKIAAAAAVMAAAVFLLSNLGVNALAVIAAGILIYALALWILREKVLDYILPFLARAPRPQAPPEHAESGLV